MFVNCQMHAHIRSSALAVILFLASTHAYCIEAVKGRVVAVADGDTLTVLDDANVQHKIRLSGIDAPERAQAFGTRSRQNLSSLVHGKYVEVEISKTDRYRRSVGKVLYQGRDVNLQQVQDGFAWHYVAYAREQPATDANAYADAQRTAHKQAVGLWADANPTPPWLFRSQAKK